MKSHTELSLKRIQHPTLKKIQHSFHTLQKTQKPSQKIYSHTQKAIIYQIFKCQQYQIAQNEIHNNK